MNFQTSSIRIKSLTNWIKINGKLLIKYSAKIEIGEGSTKLKNGKATEIDKLRNEIIKYCIKDNLFWKSRKLCLVTSLMTELIPSSGKLTL